MTNVLVIVNLNFFKIHFVLIQNADNKVVLGEKLYHQQSCCAWVNVGDRDYWKEASN